MIILFYHYVSIDILVFQESILSIYSNDCSGEEGFTMHHRAVDKAADHLCYFTQRQKEGTDRLSSETRDVLQHRVDPNAREADRRAVETLLYTPGSKSTIMVHLHFGRRTQVRTRIPIPFL